MEYIECDVFKIWVKTVSANLISYVIHVKVKKKRLNKLTFQTYMSCILILAVVSDTRPVYIVLK